MKQNWKLLLLLSSVVLAVAACGSVDADSMEYKVEIGESASMAKKVKEHNLTQEALKQGQTEYEAKTADGTAHKFTLTEKQIEDILGGTTVIVETSQGGMKVKIGPAKQKKKDSGW
ncbi:MAG TPA: hypothetical protein VLV83_16915 [Acidobacteriota bacterium]|nr:hypothetical protein [Acidobacteriota bacterium]